MRVQREVHYLVKGDGKDKDRGCWSDHDGRVTNPVTKQVTRTFSVVIACTKWRTTCDRLTSSKLTEVRLYSLSQTIRESSQELRAC